VKTLKSINESINQYRTVRPASRSSRGGGLVDKVALRRARLVLGWVTGDPSVGGYATSIGPCNQSTSTRPSALRYSTRIRNASAMNEGDLCKSLPSCPEIGRHRNVSW